MNVYFYLIVHENDSLAGTMNSMQPILKMSLTIKNHVCSPFLVVVVVGATSSSFIIQAILFSLLHSNAHVLFFIMFSTMFHFSKRPEKKPVGWANVSVNV